jgi:hypothetical protein
MRLNGKQIFIMVLVIATSLGCKTMQKIKTRDQTFTTQLVDEVKKAEPKFDNIEFGRMNIGINLNNKNQFNSAANCKIIPDSVIHISVQPFLGIEMFMIRLTPESIVVIDKTKGVFYQSDYAFFELQFGLDINYQTFEAMFTNKLFTIGAKDKTDRSFVDATDKNGHRILAYKTVSLNQHFFLNEDFRIKEIAVNASTGNEQFMVYYTDFSHAGSLLFPTGIRFQFKNKHELFTFNMSVSRLAVNETINIPNININQYRRGDILSLFK